MARPTQATLVVGASKAGLVRRTVALALRRLGAPPVRVVLWDGCELRYGCEPPVASVHIRTRGALLRMLRRPSFQFAECYREGLVDVEGNLVALLEAVNRASDPTPSLATLLAARLRRLHVGDSRSHYELGSDFYRLWLDTNMVYTCAYFAQPDATLEQAQLAKLERVCAKLDPRPGEIVVEAGCGWGALALHMARHYGVRVRAFNTSADQIAYAREWADREGLSRLVEFVHDDYRNIRERCDAFVSVGLLEHVGKRHYRRLGALMSRCLGGSGRGLLQTIARDRPRPTDPWIDRRIFPGGYTPSLGEVAEVFEPNALSILHVENLRTHYSRTLELWRERFEAAGEEVSARFDERFVRTWRLYLSAAEAGFRAGWLQLFQVLFAPSGVSPQTRYPPGALD